MVDADSRTPPERPAAAGRRAEQRLQALIAGARDGIVELNPQGLVTAANPAFCLMTGFTDTDLHGRALRELLLPETALDEALAAEPLADTEARIRRSDGAELSVEIRGAPSVDAGQTVFVRDVSRLARARATLRDLGARARRAVDLTADAMTFMDRDGRIVYMNAAAGDLFGVSPEQAVGHSIVENMSALDQALADDAWARFRQHGFGTFHPIFHRPDGTAIHTEARLVDLGDGSILAVTRDISAQVEMQKTLQAREAFHLRAQEIGHMGSWELDLESRSMRLSPEGLRIMCLPEAARQIPAAAWLGAVHPDDAETAQAAVLAPALAGEALRAELRLLAPGGALRQVLILGEPVYGQRGNVVAVAGAVQDLTDRVQLEEQLRAAQRLEAVGRLAGGVAHDFNNLLTVIAGYAEMLLAQVPEESPLHGDIAEISSAAERATALTEKLLSFSARRAAPADPLSLSALVRDQERLLHDALGNGISLSKVLADDGYVRVDPVQLGQVLMNLAINAREAMSGAGRLDIGVARGAFQRGMAEHFGLAGPGEYVVLAVVDSGCGIPDQLRDSIYEPFVSSRGATGAGLGLATVHGIIQQAGGQIRAVSAEASGTAFLVVLPAVAEPLEEAPEAAREVELPPSGSGRIVVVEDDPAVRRIACELIASLGYAYLEAVSGRDALRLLGEDAAGVDLLLTDILMPGMRGDELARQVQQRFPALPIVLMSAYAGPASNEAPMEGTTFLQKPFTRSTLAAALREGLGARPD